MTLGMGEPKRNKDYHRAVSPKRKSDASESQAMARFAVVEQDQFRRRVAFEQAHELRAAVAGVAHDPRAQFPPRPRLGIIIHPNEYLYWSAGLRSTGKWAPAGAWCGLRLC